MAIEAEFHQGMIFCPQLFNMCIQLLDQQIPLHPLKRSEVEFKLFLEDPIFKLDSLLGPQNPEHQINNISRRIDSVSVNCVDQMYARNIVHLKILAQVD